MRGLRVWPMSEYSTDGGMRQRVVGSGLVALDVVVDGQGMRNAELYAGGTCGNVLAILGSFGSDVKLISRLQSDGRWEVVGGDLSRWGVELSDAQLEPGHPAPVIVQLNNMGCSASGEKGSGGHEFVFRCPECGGWFERFRPITLAAVERFVERHEADGVSEGVFFADRASAGIVRLAEFYRSRGFAVMFEPPSIGNESHFARMLKLADCIKYSSECLSNIGEQWDIEIPLEIMTLGANGLQVRCGSGEEKSWTRQEAVSLPDDRVVDTAGAGDWCTAGLLLAIGENPREWFRTAGLEEVVSALGIGQSLASWSCQFSGARGGMYAEGWQEMLEDHIPSVGSLSTHRGPQEALSSAGRVDEEKWSVICSCDL